MSSLALYARQPSALYAAGVLRGHLIPNPAQQSALSALDSLASALQTFESSMQLHNALIRQHATERRRAIEKEYQARSRRPFLFRFLFGPFSKPELLSDAHYGIKSTPPPPPPPPRGLYVHGDVGTGKSLLVDMLFSCAAPRLAFAKRCHFHDFMAGVYHALHEFDQMPMHIRRRNHIQHPLDAVASLAFANGLQGAGLLCFDEFQIPDVADARLMHGVITRLVQRGVVTCFTSNRPPGKLNRSQICDEDLRPFLDLLHERTVQMRLEAGRDFRDVLLDDEEMQGNCEEKKYFLPACTSDDTLRKKWKLEARCNWDETVQRTLHVAHGRAFHLRHCSPSMKAVQVCTEEILRAPVGVHDFKAIAEKARIIFFTDIVPKFSRRNADVARRFITLVDVCYERKTRICMRMDADNVEELFEHALSDQPEDMPRKIEGLQFETESGQTGIGAHNRMNLQKSLYTGKDEQFAFKRAVSRLKEMSTATFEKRSPYFW